MNELLLAVAVVALGVAMFSSFLLLEERRKTSRLTAAELLRVEVDSVLVRRTVMVSLVDGRALRGVLWSRAGGLIVLKNAELIEPANPPVPMDGEVVIERGRIDFVQVLSP